MLTDCMVVHFFLCQSVYMLFQAASFSDSLTNQHTHKSTDTELNAFRYKTIALSVYVAEITVFYFTERLLSPLPE